MLHNLKRFATPRRHADEPIVQSGLAYTPSQMMQLAEKGIPVSTNNQSDQNFFDGVPVGQGSFDLPLELQKGTDVADCWQASQSARKAAKKGLKADIITYGPWKPPVTSEGGSDGSK